VGALAIITIALVARLHALGAALLSYDEAATAVLAEKSVSEIFSSLGATHHFPPLGYLMIKASMWTGTGEWQLRLPSALLGSASCLLLFAVGRRLLGAAPAGAAALLLALSSFHVNHSQEARAYALLVFLVLLADLGLLRALAEGRARDFALFGGASLLALYTHYFSVFPLAGLALFALLVTRRSPQWRSLIGRGAAVVGLTTLGFVPVVPILLERVATPYVSFDVFEWGDVGLPLALDTVRVGFRAVDSGAFLHGAAALPPGTFLDGPSVVAGLLALVGAIALARERREAALFLLLQATLPLLGALVVVSGRSFMSHRYVLVALPAYLCLVAAGGAQAAALAGRLVAQLTPRLSATTTSRAAGVALVALAVALQLGLDQSSDRPGRIGLGSYYTTSPLLASRGNGPWRWAAETVAKAGPASGDAVVFAVDATRARGSRLRWQVHAETIFSHYLSRSAQSMPTVYLANDDGYALAPAGQRITRPLVSRSERHWVVPGTPPHPGPGRSVADLAAAHERLWLVEDPAETRSAVALALLDEYDAASAAGSSPAPRVTGWSRRLRVHLLGHPAEQPVR
jgi:hypothetical protein